MVAQRRIANQQRENQAVASSQDVIAKIREDMEKGLEGLSGAYEEEHKRQLAMMEERLANRSGKVQEALEQKKIDLLRKAEQAELEKQKAHDLIRTSRAKRAKLLETITNNQKVVVKGCYSRPLYTFNKKINASQNEKDIASALNNQSLEIKEQVMSRLLKKVTDLEEKVTTDVSSKPGNKNTDRRGSLLQRL